MAFRPSAFLHIIFGLVRNKFQITNNKQITMTEIQIPNIGRQGLKCAVLVIEHWCLRFACNLMLGIWDLRS
jgi:hypothetical protein